MEGESPARGEMPRRLGRSRHCARQGEAFVALGQSDDARRAFEQALAVRERIEHPKAQAARDALAGLLQQHHAVIARSFDGWLGMPIEF